MVDAQTISIVFAGLSITASIAYYASVLRNANKTQQQALETRQAQLFMQLYNQFRDKEFQRDISSIYNIWEWTDYNDFEDKYGRTTDSEKYSSFVSVITYFEGIGVLLNQGLIDKNLVDDMMSGVIIRFWEKIMPLVEETRHYRKWPQYMEWFEYLYKEIKPIAEAQHPELKT